VRELGGEARVALAARVPLELGGMEDRVAHAGILSFPDLSGV
jgi:hypothetical protein